MDDIVEGRARLENLSESFVSSADQVSGHFWSKTHVVKGALSGDVINNDVRQSAFRDMGACGEYLVSFSSRPDCRDDCVSTMIVVNMLMSLQMC